MRRLTLLAVPALLVALVAAIRLLGATDGDGAPGAGGKVAPAPAPLAPPALPPLPPGTAHLRGRVVDEGGAPVAGAQVQVLAGGKVVAQLASAEGGVFHAAQLPPESYVLVARSGASASEPLGPIPLAPGEELADIELQLAAAAAIEGHVIDAATSAPLEGAAVSVSGAATTSGSGGFFRVEAIPPGLVVLRASAPGYEAREQPLELHQGTLGGVEVPLRRAAILKGRVLAASGEGVPGAAVWVVPYRLAPGPPPPDGARSGEGGSFEIAAPAGQVQVAAVSMSGETGRSAPVDVAAGSVREGLRVTLGPSATVQGRVSTVDGSGVAGAEVHVLQHGVTAASTATDPLGFYRVAGLAPGSVSAVAVAGAGRATAGPVEVGQGEAAQLDLVLGGSSVSGVVVDDRGSGLAGASVFAHPEGTPRTLAATTTSGPGGRFELHGLPGELLRVGASAGGAEGELRGVAPGSTDLRVLVAGGQLVGLVLRDGAPASDFTIAVAPLAPGQPGARTAHLLAPDGRFRMSLAPGAWEVRASAPGTTAARATADVPARGAAEVRLDLDEGGVIEGRVLDADTGAPVAGARVSTNPGGTSAILQAADYPGVSAGVSAADGSFRLTGVRPGPGAVFARHEAYAWARPARVNVVPGVVSRVEVRLPRDREGRGGETFGGVGMSLRTDRKDGRVLAANVFPGSPSWEAGIRSGDRVLTADGVPVTGLSLDAVVDRVRGEVGTPVVLELQRGDRRFRAVVVRTELRF